MIKYGFGALALTVFGIFFANILTGKLLDQPFLTDVQDFLTLALACLLFVAMILAFERDASTEDEENGPT